MCIKPSLISLCSLNWFVEDTLWTGVPWNYTNPNAPAALSEVRKLVDNGEYAEATKAAVKLSDNPSDVCYLFYLWDNYYFLSCMQVCLGF